MYNGLIGGIGEGLQAFNQAYQQALNYQLEKQKAANLADYQQQTADAAQANAAAGLLQQGGSPLLKAAGGNLHLKPMEGGSNDPSALDNIQPMMVRQAMMSAQKEAADKTNASQAEGTNIKYEVDPTNPTTTRIANQGQLTGKALLEQQKTQAGINVDTSGSRSPLETVQQDFNKNPQVSAARTSKVYMDQMQDLIENPAPESQAAARLIALKIRFPNQVQDAQSLEELRDSESAPVKIKNAASQYLLGLNDQTVTRNLARDAISSFNSNYGGYQDAKKDYLGKATTLYGQDSKKAAALMQDSGLDSSYQKAIDLKNKLGPYEAAKESGGIIGTPLQWMGKKLGLIQGGDNSNGGLIGGGNTANASAPVTPPMTTMYKDGSAFQVPTANVKKAAGRGYSLEKK